MGWRAAVQVVILQHMWVTAVADAFLLSEAKYVAFHAVGAGVVPAVIGSHACVGGVSLPSPISASMCCNPPAWGHNLLQCD
jgi:hypothetical protein